MTSGRCSDRWWCPHPRATTRSRCGTSPLAYRRIPGLYEMKTPKTAADLRTIASVFAPYLGAREWRTIQNPAP